MSSEGAQRVKVQLTALHQKAQTEHHMLRDDLRRLVTAAVTKPLKILQDDLKELHAASIQHPVSTSESDETTALLPTVMPTYRAVGVMPQSDPTVDMVRGRKPYRGGGGSDTRCLGPFPEGDQR